MAAKEESLGANHPEAVRAERGTRQVVSVRLAPETVRRSTPKPPGVGCRGRRRLRPSSETRRRKAPPRERMGFRFEPFEDLEGFGHAHRSSVASTRASSTRVYSFETRPPGRDAVVEVHDFARCE